MANSFVRSILFFCLLSGLDVSIAHADAETATKVVRFGDLNLASEDGQTELRRRVRYAVEIVCGDADSRDLSAMRAIHTCRVAAQASAGPQIDLAIANARSGKAYAALSVRITPAVL